MATQNTRSSRDELVAERQRVEDQIAKLHDAESAENAPMHIDELEDRLHELDALIDRIDIAVAMEREMDA